VPWRERARRVLELLDAGIKPSRSPKKGEQHVGIEMFPANPPYRRMSEHPSGVLPSGRQPRPPRLTAPVVDSGPPPESADIAAVALGSSAPVPSSAPPMSAPEPVTIDEPLPEEATVEIPPREAQEPVEPYDDDESGERERDTQPWRDDDPDSSDDAPVSVTGEFSSSLSEAPSDEAKIHEDHRAFRHRGPFTRAQAELAVSQAPDVQTVLEILVRYARQFFERTILLVVHGERAVLRLAHGISRERASFQVLLGEPSVLRESFESGDPVIRPLAKTGVDASIKAELGVGDERVAVVPLQIRERVVGLFYGDDRRDPVDRDAVADVTDFTEICAAEITRLVVQRKRSTLR
jgi:hypothetical protein